MTECDEVAEAMAGAAPPFACLDDAIRYVRGQMPDESMTVIDNVAWALWRRPGGGARIT